MAQGFTEDTPRASELVQGKSRLSVAPVDPYFPIAVGDNDPRLSTISGNQPSYFTGYAFAVWSGVGLIFDCLAPIYYLNGTSYPADAGQIVLDPADPTYARFDAIIVDEFGLNKITGTPDANPVLPTVNPLTQLVITYVSVPANATTPVGITDQLVYNENVEAVVSSNNGTLDADSVVNPFTGTKHILLGAFNNTHYVDFTFGTSKQIIDYTVLRYFIYLPIAFSNITYLKIQFFDGATAVSTVVNIPSGNYNFNGAVILTYQIIVIPISSFTFTQSEFTKIRITFNGNNAVGFYFDYFTLQSGTPSLNPQQDAITSIVTDSGIANATEANDQFIINGKEGTVVTASGKTIEITAIPLITASGTDTYTGTLTTPIVTNHLFRVAIPNNNTGAATFNTIPITKNVTDPLEADDLKANGVYILHYDGTNLQVIGLGGGGGGHEILDEAGTPLAQEPQLQFVRLNATADTGKTVVTRPADSFMGIAPPSNPVEGDVWTDNTDTVWRTYVWYDGYWVERAEGSGVSYNTDYSQYAKIQAIWYHLNSF